MLWEKFSVRYYGTDPDETTLATLAEAFEALPDEDFIATASFDFDEIFTRSAFDFDFTAGDFVLGIYNIFIILNCVPKLLYMIIK